MNRTKISCGGYTITASKDGEHPFVDLPKDICKEMCECEDKGNRYEPSSRYTYWTEHFKTHKGVSFGTAYGAIQKVIMELMDYKGLKFSKTIRK